MPRSYIHQTNCRYTLGYGCCDPTVPWTYLNTNDLKKAEREFDKLVKDNEENDDFGGGEWSITLWEHTPESFPVQMRFEDHDKRYGGGLVIHSVFFDGSIPLKRAGYSWFNVDENGNYKAEIHTSDQPYHISPKTLNDKAQNRRTHTLIGKTHIKYRGI